MAGMPGIVIKVGVDAKNALGNLGKVEKQLRRSLTPAQKFNNVLGKTAKSLAVAGAAAAAAAIAIGVDAAQAAIAEEKELALMDKTLSNLGFADATKDVNAFIDQLQYTANVSEGELRPAFERLIRSTDSVEEAQRALNLALDISAGTGKDLDTVTAALGKAYDGNTASLGRLGLGLDKALLSSGDMVAITEEMTRLFAGQSAAAADTLAGAVAGVQIAVDELSESFGQGLLGATEDSTDALEDMETTLRNLQPAAENAGNAVNKTALAALGFTNNVAGLSAAADSGDWELFFRILQAGAEGADTDMAVLANTAQDAGREFEYLQYAAYGANTALSATASRWNAIAAAAARAAVRQRAAMFDAAQATWNSGFTTQREQADYAYNAAQARARDRRQAEKRKAARAAARQRDAVSTARAAELARRKAQQRTGVRYSSSPSSGRSLC